MIEVKKDGRPAEIKDDEEKIRSSWFGRELHYQYGAIINIKQDSSYEINVIENGAQYPW